MGLAIFGLTIPGLACQGLAILVQANLPIARFGLVSLGWPHCF
jgi:hypothetical protein